MQNPKLNHPLVPDCPRKKQRQVTEAKNRSGTSFFNQISYSKGKIIQITAVEKQPEKKNQETQPRHGSGIVKMLRILPWHRTLICGFMPGVGRFFTQTISLPVPRSSSPLRVHSSSSPLRPRTRALFRSTINSSSSSPLPRYSMVVPAPHELSALHGPKEQANASW